MDRQPPLVRVLPRHPGTKESRYMHLFANDTIPQSDDLAPVMSKVSATNAHDARIGVLESEVSSLKREVVELRQQLSALQEQFN